MIDWDSPLISLYTKYSSIYNMRPNEMYGMGKESLTVSGYSSPKEFMDSLVANSKLRHESDEEWIIGTEDTYKNSEWTSWIGQPSHYIVDIQYRELSPEEAKEQQEAHAAFLTKYNIHDKKSWVKTGYNEEEWKAK